MKGSFVAIWILDIRKADNSGGARVVVRSVTSLDKSTTVVEVSRLSKPSF